MEAVVLAANRLSSARVTSNADDGDRGAGHSDNDIKVLNNDTQEGEDLGGGVATSLAGAVTALNRSSVALASGDGPTSRCGSCKGSESEGDKNRGFELHVGV